MPFIDSHTHLDFLEFDVDRSQVVNRAIKAKISRIIISATTAHGWQNLENIVEKHSPLCFSAYGLHPMFMSEHQEKHLEGLPRFLQKERAVAVGEIGLDYFIPLSNPSADKQAQLDLFIAQLEIASEMKLPVIIHARKSLDIILKYLRRYPDIRGSIHGFSGSEQQANQLIDLGFYLGFGGPITYTRATKLQKLVKTLPLESILLETDSPDQPVASHYGERNEPAFLPKVAETIATLRGISIKQVASTTTKNAQTLFKFNERDSEG